YHPLLCLQVEAPGGRRAGLEVERGEQFLDVLPFADLDAERRTFVNLENRHALGLSQFVFDLVERNREIERRVDRCRRLGRLGGIVGTSILGVLSVRRRGRRRLLRPGGRREQNRAKQQSTQAHKG